MKKQVKKSLDNYSKPTPKKMRKIGDSIFGLGTVITTLSAVIGSPWVTITSAIVTWAGKTITNFWSED